MSERILTDLDPLGRARMVDVAPRDATHRRAVARCKVEMLPETTAKVASNAISKGDVLAAARVAGIQAAKRAADLIPLCHPLLVGSVNVNFTIGDDHVEVETQVETFDRTGVEMEALTACRGGGAHRLRHVQVGRPHHDDRRAPPVGEVGRALGELASARRRRGRAHCLTAARQPAERWLTAR